MKLPYRFNVKKPFGIVFTLSAVVLTLTVVVKGVLALFYNFSLLNLFGVTFFSVLLFLWYRIGLLAIPFGDQYVFTDEGIHFKLRCLFPQLLFNKKVTDFTPVKNIKKVSFVRDSFLVRHKLNQYYIHNHEGKVFNSIPEPGTFNQDWFKAYFEHFKIPIEQASKDDRNWTKLFTEEMKSKSSSKR